MQNVLNLNEYGVAQMQNAEMVETEGGIEPISIGLAAFALGSGLVALGFAAFTWGYDRGKEAAQKEKK